MKDRRRIFGLLLAVSAGLSFWWLASQDDDATEESVTAVQLPDSYFKDLEIVSHDDTGTAVSRLHAARANHFPNDPKVYLEQLRTRGLEAGDDWELQAARGEFDPDNDILDAQGNVQLSTTGNGPDETPMILHTDRLQLNAKDEIAVTDLRVDITQGKSYIQGKGLYADLANDYIRIPAGVTARYEE